MLSLAHPQAVLRLVAHLSVLCVLLMVELVCLLLQVLLSVVKRPTTWVERRPDASQVFQ